MGSPTGESRHPGEGPRSALRAPQATLPRLVAPPPPGRGTCRCCRGFSSPGWNLCHSCTAVLSQVPFPCTSVLPISLYQIPGPLHAVLRGYKEGGSEALHHATWLGLLLTAFLRLHGPCLTGPLAWDELVVVPSTRRGRTPHPLEAALRQALWWERVQRGPQGGTRPIRSALISRPKRDIPPVPGPEGPYPPRPLLSGSPSPPAMWPSPRLVRSGAAVHHARADHHAFAVARSVAGRRVLLVDDTWTTGARAESAASALSGAGAVVVGIVVVGRVVEPRTGLERRRAWQEACERPFDPWHCAAEDAGRAAEDLRLHALKAEDSTGTDAAPPSGGTVEAPARRSS
jgi:predicted amidophosphoribosyltransferase